MQSIYSVSSYLDVTDIKVRMINYQRYQQTNFCVVKDVFYRVINENTLFFFFFWQGVIEDRIGFFPAAFAHLVRAGDRVFRCNRTFIGCKEQGQITLKEGQVLYSLYVAAGA